VREPQNYKSEIREVVNIGPYGGGQVCNWTLICETLAAYNVTGIGSAFLFNYKAYYPSQYVPHMSPRDELALAIESEWNSAFYTSLPETNGNVTGRMVKL
jgi:hypothetical protein